MELPWVPDWDPAALTFLFSLTLFYFLFFGGKSRETQTGYSELNCVIRLRQATLGMVQGFYPWVCIFSFILEHS